MTSVTNISNRVLDFTVGSKGGDPHIETVRPGETKTLSLDKDHPLIVSRVNAQQIRLGRVSAKAATPAPRNRVENPEPTESKGS